MDPLSQAVLGASLSQASTKDKSKQVSALIIGALAGMAPDLDILIRSPNDPLLFLEYHRQFTHSLAFIPFGAFICSLFFYPFFKKKLAFLQIFIFALLGFATHGLLDACTSYGTQLYWPFSNERVAWNLVSIIDPLFTIPIIIFVGLAAYRRKVNFARIGFAYAIIFLSLGLVQKQRAEDSVRLLALQRGHTIERFHIKPSFANRHLWKTLYEYNNHYYVDAVKLLWDKKIITGSSIKKLDVTNDYPWIAKDTQQAKDIERFRWFSSDYISADPLKPGVITDVRYSYIPNDINLMWGIKLNKSQPESHVEFIINSRPTKVQINKFFDLLF